MKLFLLVLFVLHISANAELPQDDGFFSEESTIVEKKMYYDPFEKFNRVSFKIMKFGNNYFLLPAAKTYDRVVPKFLHSHIKSVVQNSRQPINAINGTLIPSKPMFLAFASKFLFNTTFGFFGFFDVHSQYSSMKTFDINLDDTAQYYYSKPLPYLVLPMGFGNVFTIADFAETTYLFNLFETSGEQAIITSSTALNILTSIHANKDQIEDALNNSLDPYSVLRTVYYQIQQGKISTIKQIKNDKKYKSTISREFLNF